MTLLQIRTLVLSLLDDVNAGYFTAPQVNVWINNGQKEVQKMIAQAFEGYNLKRVKTQTVLNQREYSLPDDFKRLHRLDIVLSGTEPTEQVQRLQKITRNQQDRVFNQSGTPAFYYFQGDYVVVVPAPSQQWDLRLTYEYLISDLVNDTDSPDLPKQYHEMIAILAARDGLLKDGRDASLMLAKLKDFETALKRDAEQRNADESRTIVQTQDDDDFYGYF